MATFKVAFSKNMIESHPSTTVFLVLESTFFVLQCLFMFTRLRTKRIGRFLVVNALFIGINVLYLFNTHLTESVIDVFTYQASIGLLLLSSFWYLSTMVQISRLKKRARVISVLASIGIVLLMSVVFVLDLLEFNEIILLTAALIILLFITVFLVTMFLSMEKNFGVILTLILSFNLASFSVYLGNSLIDLNIFLNLTFLILSGIHLVLFIRNINRLAAHVEREEPVSLREALTGFELSQRQIEIAEYVIQGYSSKEIASICNIHKDTVTKHVSNINKKVGVGDREELKRMFVSNTKSKQ